MTHDKRKDAARARQAATGEPYMEARRQVRLEMSKFTVRPASNSAHEKKLGDLTGSALNAYLVAELANVLAEQYGGNVRSHLAAQCELEADWRRDKAEEYPDDPRNEVAAANLVACARDLAAMGEDARLKVISAAWADQDLLDQLGDTERRILGWVGFNMSGQELIDELANEAAQLLLGAEADENEESGDPEQDVMRRATDIYKQAHLESPYGSGADEFGWPRGLAYPSNDSGLAKHEGQEYVVVRNVNGVLAVYEIGSDDALTELEEWPEELAEF